MRAAAVVAALLLAACAAGPGRSGAGAPSGPAARPRATPLDLTGRLLLDNGFEAHLVPRPGTPLVAMLVAVRAGSRHETSPTRGAAHLLEHLVFEGTAARGRDEIFRWVYGAGGYLNGFTRDDFTGYVLMGPPGQLRPMARLLADLLGGARLSAEALSGVKAVVLEELRQARSDPDYRDDLAFRAARFHGTPYAEPPLGTETTIGAIALEDLSRFYRAYYTPANMVALAVGGAPAEEMAAALREAFGPLPRGGGVAVEAAAPTPRAIPGGAVVRAGTQRAARVGLLGPPAADPAFGDFLALGDLLGGPASPLPAALSAVRAPSGLAPTAAASTGSGAAVLDVRATLPPGVDADAALSGLVAALQRVARTLDAETAARAAQHGRLEAARLAERIHYLAMARAPLLVAGRVDLALGEPSAPSPAALRAALSAALARGYVALLPARSEPPGPAVARESRRVETRLANGLVVAAEQRAGAPVVAAHLLARGRLLAEPEGLPGAAEILHRLIGGRLQALPGATVHVAEDPREPFGDFYFARDFSGIRLEALPDAAEVALRRLAGAVAAPPSERRAVAAARSATAEVADFRATDPRSLAEDRLWARLFDGPPGVPPAGAAGTFARATPRALAAFHRRYFAPQNLVLTLVGAESPERLVALAERTFGTLPQRPGPEVVAPRPAAVPAAADLERVEVDTPQAQVRLGAVVEVRDAGERAALEIAVGLLGAALFSTLRDQQGLAYSVGAEVSAAGDHAVVTAGLGTAPASADRALGEVRRLIAARATAAVTSEEVARRASAIAGRLASRQLSSATRAYYLGAALHAGLPHRFGEDYATLLRSITPAQVEAVQRRAFSGPFSAVIVR